MKLTYEESSQRIAHLIERTVERRGFPPTRRELMTACGWTSPATAQRVIALMIRQGLITVEPGVSRGIRISKTAMKAVVEEV